jgi:nicotinamide mononucleotide adenylyltransferase
MNYLVIYPGRFHPFHRGHLASYEYLTKKYGPENVYIATSDVQAPVTSPFSYSDKVAMMTKLGIPAGHIVQVRNPYQAKEIVDNLPEETKNDTALIFALSEKDMAGEKPRFTFGTKKNGEPSYMQPLPEDKKFIKPLTKHAYVDITPTVNFKVRGVDASSASEVRKMYLKGNDADRDQIITELYGAYYPELRDIFDRKLGVAEQVKEYIKEARNMRTERSIAWLERVLILEQQAHPSAPDEDLIVDYLDEKKH